MAKRGDEASTLFFNFLHVNAAPQNYCSSLWPVLSVLPLSVVFKWYVLMGKVKLFLQYTAVETAWRTLEEYLG